MQIKPPEGATHRKPMLLHKSNTSEEMKPPEGATHRKPMLLYKRFFFEEYKTLGGRRSQEFHAFIKKVYF